MARYRRLFRSFRAGSTAGAVARLALRLLRRADAVILAGPASPPLWSTRDSEALATRDVGEAVTSVVSVSPGSGVRSEPVNRVVAGFRHGGAAAANFMCYRIAARGGGVETPPL